jgi:predicted O-methyltransferase YrrM
VANILIFLKAKIYRFNSLITKPLILDCGANVGVSVLYFKRLYPDAEIIAFEPDEDVFAILKQNYEESKP